MKQKSPRRLKSELWKQLRPEANLPMLAHDIITFLENHSGKSTRNQNLAHNLATYLTQKYSISDRKSKGLDPLIEHHPDDLAAFLNEVRFKDFQALGRTLAGHPQPNSPKKFAKALVKIPDQLPPSADEPLRRKKKPRPRPQNENERRRRRKQAKERYEERRREYRRGLIVEQFGTLPFQTFIPQSAPQGPCLDGLFRGEPVRMAAQAGALEDLFGMDRKRFPKRLRPKRSGRNAAYDLDDFVECMIHLLANANGKEQWLPEGLQRDLVLVGIIARALRCSPEVGDKLAEKLRPYVSKNSGLQSFF